MSSRAKKEYERIGTESENTKNQVYSDNLNLLMGMVKGLYKEAQELLKPGVEIEILVSSQILPIYKFTQDGVEIKKGEIIPAEEFVERVVKYGRTNKQKFLALDELISSLHRLEHNYGIKLTEKYLPKDTSITKIYRPGLTKPQIRAIENALRSRLNLLEKPIILSPIEKKWGDVATETADDLLKTQIKNTQDALNILEKELGEK